MRGTCIGLVGTLAAVGHAACADESCPSELTLQVSGRDEVRADPVVGGAADCRDGWCFERVSINASDIVASLQIVETPKGRSVATYRGTQCRGRLSFFAIDGDGMPDAAPFEEFGLPATDYVMIPTARPRMPLVLARDYAPHGGSSVFAIHLEDVGGRVVETELSGAELSIGLVGDILGEGGHEIEAWHGTPVCDGDVCYDWTGERVLLEMNSEGSYQLVMDLPTDLGTLTWTESPEGRQPVGIRFEDGPMNSGSQGTLVKYDVTRAGFTALESISLGPVRGRVATGDIDGDGYDDLVVTEQATALNVFLGPDFSAPAIVHEVTNIDWHLITLADLDGDSVAEALLGSAVGDSDPRLLLISHLEADPSIWTLPVIGDSAFPAFAEIDSVAGADYFRRWGRELGWLLSRPAA